MFAAPDPRRILVVANETITGQALRDAIVAYDRATEILIVAPALNTRLHHWTSDEDRARAAAELRLSACVDSLEEAGMQAHGWVGDADPMRAIEDALAIVSVDELLIATHPEERSNWLAHDLVARACARFSLPVLHVVVDRAVTDSALVLAA